MNGSLALQTSDMSGAQLVDASMHALRFSGAYAQGASVATDEVEKTQFGVIAAAYKELAAYYAVLASSRPDHG